MPDVTFPSITVRVSYPGVGPLEMEELVTRPIEQAVSAVAGRGADQLDLVGRQRHGPPELRVGHQPQRRRRRRPQPCRPGARPAAGRRGRADPVQVRRVGRCRSWASASKATSTAVTLRELAQNILSPRLERVPGVAAVSVDGGLRRQIHVELSKEKIAALDLSVDRIVSLLREREREHAARRDRRRRHDLPAAQPGAVREPGPDPRPRRPDAKAASRSTCATSPT